MTSPPQEPVSAAEEDPTVEPDTTDAGAQEATASDPPVSSLLTSEDDLPDESSDEVEIGLGP